MNQITIKKVAVTTGLFLGAFALSVMAADWTPAGCAAPGCNTEAPINVGSNQQTKSGALTIGGASQNADGSSFFVNGLIKTVGLFVEGMATVDSLNVASSLKVTSTGFATANSVLTNVGGGVAEWKVPAAGGLTLSEVTAFPLSVVRNGGLQTYTTATPYLFCALTRIESELGRVDAGAISSGFCKVTKNADGKWKLSGYLADDPDFTCEMTCFK